MNGVQGISSVSLRRTLPFAGAKAYSFSFMLLVAAALLPAAAHLCGAPVRMLLPMHWPIILAGLVYGSRAGLLVGAASPLVSFMISGMPLPLVLPAMTLELAVYGFGAGFLREHTKWNATTTVAISLIAGRAVFVAVMLLTGSLMGGFAEYFKIAMVPGLVAALGQIILLPLLAKWWVAQERPTDER